MTVAKSALQRFRQERPDSSDIELRVAFWNSEKGALLDRHRAGSSGVETARTICDNVDALVLDIYAAAVEAYSPASHAVVALGGYGRREMSPYSDVDVLFLFARDRDKHAEFIAAVLRPLWDMGFDVGHASRTPTESVRLARQDIASCTAMMDARFLAGDVDLFAGFSRRLYKQLPKSTLGRLHKVQSSRGNGGGGSVQLLEPNVKESPGGLRDIHLLEWALKTTSASPAGGGDLWEKYLDDEGAAAVSRGRDFLWRVRHELHFAMARKHDVLETEMKPTVALNLGYTDRSVLVGTARDTAGASPAQSGVHARVGTADRRGDDVGLEFASEHFMREYYLHARAISHHVELGFGRLTSKPKRRSRPLLLEEGVTVVNGEIELIDGYFGSDPSRLLTVFALSQQKRLPLSEQAQRLVQRSHGFMDNATRSDPAAREIFMGILRRRSRVAGTLRIMHELGVLGAYLPEFAGLTCLVQYDIYHLYTVDEHTLVALERLEQISRTDGRSLLRMVYYELERRDLLFLGALLHDVGKSRREEHVSSGMEMAATLMSRMNLPDADRRFVLFLVERHQEMVIISQRRDLDDYKMIAEFAGLCESTEWLRALYLLSYADLSAVASEAWTDWQGALLWELYHKTKEQLESGIKTLEDRQHAEEMLDEHLQQMEGTWPAPKVTAFREHVLQLPPRYLVAYEIGDIERHLDLFARLEEDCVVEFVQRPDHVEIVVCTRDQKQLLAKICGVLAVHDIDILRADVQTRDDDVVIDVFQVTDVDGTPTLPEWKQTRVSRRLAGVIGGSVQVAELFASYSTRWSQRRRRDQPLRAPEVAFENQVSERYTVIDTDVQDDVGLLYKITHALGEADLDIHMAIVNTVAERARDAFYVVDRRGEKIVNYETLEAVRTRLIQSLTGD